jgi:phosphatidylinositol kinase/protein kinase (PI-3  family)
MCRDSPLTNLTETDIRTYAVMPLNEECGLLEWVNNTIALRAILTKLYEREKKKVFVRCGSEASGVTLLIV